MWKYSVYIRAVDTLTLYFVGFMLSQLESLCYLCLFSNELNKKCNCVCVCVDISFFIHVRVNHHPVSGVCYLIHRVTFFSLLKLFSLSLLFLDALLLHFSLPLNISRCRIANMKP